MVWGSNWETGNLQSCYVSEAVYSDQYTAGAADNEPSQCIQRVPYFTLVRTVYDERDERNEKLTEQLDIVKET